MYPSLSREEVQRYSRHLILPDVGMEGQRKLKASSVLVVGTGGLGSPIALYLAAAGVGRLGLVDYDTVDSSNLQRQIIHGSDRLGQPKVESARRRLLELNPYIQVDAYNTLFSASNAMEIAAEYDLLVDGTDNFPTRYLLNDLSVLSGKPYVYGSIYRFEGQVSVFDARSGPCYRCLFPDPPPPGAVPSCGEGGVFGILPGTIGTLQATEALKLLLGIGETLTGKLLLYDALDLSFQTIQLRKNPRCRICGTEPSVTSLVDYEAFCGAPANDHAAPVPPAEWDVEPLELSQRLGSAHPPLLLDVREAVELHISALPGACNIPLYQLAARLDELEPQQEIVAFCRTGVRSTRALHLLRAAGFTRVHNLRGGINAYAQQVDPALFQY